MGDADREDREDTGEIRIVTCNANRLIDDDLMRDAVDEMRQRRVHIVNGQKRTFNKNTV